MLVDGESLDAAPAADELLEAAGRKPAERENGDFVWNHALALHSIEFRCGLKREHEGLAATLAASLRLANEGLGREGLRLMPTAMHPWLDPSGAKLWPHGTSGTVNAALDSIFSCKTHGWANQQSFTIALPFAGDEEFARLHAAVRFLLPILPASPRARPSSAASGTASRTIASSRIAASVRVFRP